MLSDKCEIKDCNGKASRIGSLPESGIIDMCADCYEKLYKRWKKILKSLLKVYF